MAPALTELDEDILGLIERHLLEGLPHQEFNRPRVPVLGGLGTQQVRLWGQSGQPQPGLSSARGPWSTVQAGAGVCSCAAFWTTSSPLLPSQLCVSPQQQSPAPLPVTNPQILKPGSRSISKQVPGVHHTTVIIRLLSQQPIPHHRAESIGAGWHRAASLTFTLPSSTAWMKVRMAESEKLSCSIWYLRLFSILTRRRVGASAGVMPKKGRTSAPCPVTSTTTKSTWAGNGRH